MVSTPYKRNWAGPEARRLIGSILRDARKHLKLRLREVDQATGVNYSHVHRIEVGSRGLPPLESLDAIAAAVQVDPIHLRAIAIAEGLTRAEATRLATYLLEPAKHSLPIK